jgi:hypothetical protein
VEIIKDGALYLIDDHYTLSLFFGEILLFCPEWNQRFTYNREELTQEDLLLEYPDRRCIVRAAKEHTRGRLNKEKFIASAKDGSKKGLFELQTYEVLVSFISTCNCAPSKVLMALYEMGLGHLSQHLDFYEESEFMKESVEVLEYFINNYNTIKEKKNV